jgi:methylmalonyl-CoA mutase cobalamin-binding subunit
MSALGHEQTSRHVRVTVMPLKADIHQRGVHVRYVPIADMLGDK